MKVASGCERTTLGKISERTFMSEETQSRTPGPNKLPKRYLQFQKRYPQVFQAYDALGSATAEAGPLSDQRRALEAGCSPEEIYHVALLGTTTLGFPTMMKTFSWMDDVVRQKE